MHAFTGKQQAPSKPSEGVSAAENLKNVKHKLIIMSGKGGVGKSTVTVNLAFSLAKKGKAVGILDADMHGPSIPKMLGLSDMTLAVNDNGRIVPTSLTPSLKVISMAFLLRDPDSPVIWRGPVKMGAIKQFLEEVEWGDLDYLIVDLPPGTGDEPLSVAQLVPDPDGAIVVTTPQDVALLSVRKSINFAKAVKLRPIGLVENMSGLKCPHCGKDIEMFDEGGVETAVRELGIPLLGKLPLSRAIAKSGDNGVPFVATEGDDVTAIFDAITDRVIAAVEKVKET
jgi:ATP-binding protein involved in chromosome partitioning